MHHKTPQCIHHCVCSIAIEYNSLHCTPPKKATCKTPKKMTRVRIESCLASQDWHKGSQGHMNPNDRIVDAICNPNVQRCRPGKLPMQLAFWQTWSRRSRVAADNFSKGLAMIYCSLWPKSKSGRRFDLALDFVYRMQGTVHVDAVPLQNAHLPERFWEAVTQIKNRAELPEALGRNLENAHGVNSQPTSISVTSYFSHHGSEVKVPGPGDLEAPSKHASPGALLKMPESASIFSSRVLACSVVSYRSTAELLLLFSLRKVHEKWENPWSEFRICENVEIRALIGFSSEATGANLWKLFWQ